MTPRITITFFVIFTSLFLLIIGIYSSRIWYKKTLIKKTNTYSGHPYTTIQNADIWMIGDSRMKQWSNTGFTKVSVLNYGVDGFTSFVTKHLLSELLTKNKPKYIILQVGINDLKIIGVAPADSKMIVNNTIKNIKGILELSPNNEITFILTTIFPTSRVELKRIFYWNSKVQEAIMVVNKNLLEYCKINSIPYLDSYSLLIDENGQTKLNFFSDCLHLNTPGYDYLNIHLEQLLNNSGIR